MTVPSTFNVMDGTHPTKRTLDVSAEQRIVTEIGHIVNGT